MSKFLDKPKKILKESLFWIFLRHVFILFELKIKIK